MQMAKSEVLFCDRGLIYSSYGMYLKVVCSRVSKECPWQLPQQSDTKHPSNKMQIAKSWGSKGDMAPAVALALLLLFCKCNSIYVRSCLQLNKTGWLESEQVCSHPVTRCCRPDSTDSTFVRPHPNNKVQDGQRAFFPPAGLRRIASKGLNWRWFSHTSDVFHARRWCWHVLVLHANCALCRLKACCTGNVNDMGNSFCCFGVMNNSHRSNLESIDSQTKVFFLSLHRQGWLPDCHNTKQLDLTIEGTSL